MWTDPTLSRQTFPLGGRRDELASVLYRVLGGLLVCALMGLGAAPLIPDRPMSAFLSYGSLAFSAAGGLVFLRMGRVSWVASFTPAVIWGVVMSSVWAHGGMVSPALYATPAVIFLAGLLWNGRYAVGLAALTCLVTGAMAYRGCDVPSPRDSGDGLAQWLPYALSLMVSAWIMVVALAVISSTLWDASARESRSRELLEQSPDGVLVLSHQGRIEQINLAAEMLLGRPRQDLLGQDFRCLGLRCVDASALLEALVETALQGEPVAPAEVEIARPDGTLVAAEAAFRAVEHAGRSWALGVTLRDITERTRADRERAVVEQQLAHAQKLELVGQLAGGVAHDFNNYLAVILSATDLAVGQLRQGLPALEALREVRAAGERSAALTRQLLAFSRKQVPHPELVDPNSVVTESLKLMRRVLGEPVRLRRELGRELGRIQIDPTQLEVALVNLCVNARDAMPGGGEILISTESVEITSGQSRGALSLEPGPHVVISVKDSGSGMTQDVMRQCFEPFFTTKGAGAGTGLGLSTVLGIVRQANGSVEVESALEQGSTFRLILPAVRGDSSSHLPLLPSEGLWPTASGTLLVVEDDEMVRGVACTILSRGGYTVIEAASAEEALELARSRTEPVDLVLTDVVLPALRGPELVRELRLIWPRLPALYVSGYVRTAPESEFADPNDVLLAKPFGASALLRAVRKRMEA